MKHSTLKSTLNLISMMLVLGSADVVAQMVHFKPLEDTAIEAWRITHDATVRDTGNYHNTQCWSHDGRYICYTQYAADEKEFGTRTVAEVHLFDLQEDKDVKVDQGLLPRWANRKPWLIYMRVCPEELYDKEAQVMWLDLDSGKCTRIAYDVGGNEGHGAMAVYDATDNSMVVIGARESQNVSTRPSTAISNGARFTAQPLPFCEPYRQLTLAF
ncbi:MAG: hypothetical protein H8E66_29540 [Planctomycetes bacterium]|nr:hypothetical protein [Planctomycetota bacterium]